MIALRQPPDHFDETIGQKSIQVLHRANAVYLNFPWPSDTPPRYANPVENVFKIISWKQSHPSLFRPSWLGETSLVIPLPLLTINRPSSVFHYTPFIPLKSVAISPQSPSSARHQSHCCGHATHTNLVDK
jgi:hypothetical protein